MKASKTDIKFNSKKDLWLGLVLWTPILFFFGLTLYEFNIAGSLIMGLTVAFIGYMWFDTTYHIDGDILKVNCGPIKFRSIPIDKITELKNTRSLISSPALSLDRIRIKYNRYDELLVSPKDKKAFLKALTEINPSIRLRVD